MRVEWGVTQPCLQGRVYDPSRRLCCKTIIAITATDDHLWNFRQFSCHRHEYSSGYIVYSKCICTSSTPSAGRPAPMLRSPSRNDRSDGRADSTLSHSSFNHTSSSSPPTHPYRSSCPRTMNPGTSSAAARAARVTESSSPPSFSPSPSPTP